MEHLHLPQEVDVHRQPHLQDAPSVLNHEDLEEDFESPSASSTEPEQTVSRFATIDRSIEDLPVTSIRHFNLIPDFFHPTSNDKPIVVRTPEGLFCLDGYDLIEEARNAGVETLSCEVDTMAEHSDAELCVRKAAIRSATRGGKGEYLENARNARDLKPILLSSNDSLRDLDHGGRRRGEGFVANPEDDVRHVIALRLGKEKDTVNTYLRHLEYLSDEAIQFFIARGAKKQFFEKAQKQKRLLLRTYTADGTPEEDIMQNVSSLLMGLFTRQAERRGSSRRPRTASTSNQTLTFNVTDHPVEPIEHQGDEAHGDAEGMEAQNPHEDFERTAPNGDDMEECLTDEEDADPDTGSVQTVSSSIIEEAAENVAEQLAETYSVPKSTESVSSPTLKNSRHTEAEFVGEILQVLYEIADRYENLMPDISARELEGMLLESISMQQELVQHIQIFRKKK
jgi:hypothetical protein